MDATCKPWQRDRAVRTIETQLGFMEAHARVDRFSRDSRIALYGKMTMAAELGAITFGEWSGYYDRLRAITELENGGE